MIALHEITRQYPRVLQRPEFYDQMMKEYLHHQMLQSLFRSKYAGQISFLGGAALRYFYDIKRFSEDLDFDCFNLTRDQFFEMTDKVEKDLQASGYDVFLDDKPRHLELNAFRRVFMFPGLKYKMGISQQKEARLFIKIEAEAHHYNYESDIKTLIGFGITTPVRIVPLGILFSSKIAAAIKRKKDRDFYDVVTMINFAKPDFGYLENKCRITSAAQLKDALLNAAEIKNLSGRKVFDCEHMLFNKTEVDRIRTFAEYIGGFDFSRLGP